ncbi:MAG: transposase, partial [Candidatus Heimdallarchaeota archaeon]
MRDGLKSSQPTQMKIIKPRLKFCVSCRVNLIFKYKQDHKTVYCLDKTVFASRWSYRCPNDSCKKYAKSVLGRRIGLKNHSVGYDLLTEIGIQRVNRKKTLFEIQEHLLAVYGISISEKHISNLADKYLQLIGNRVHESTLDKLRSRGNVIISIDGVRPQKANTTLYIIREVVSGKILLARVIVNSATQYIAKLYQEIKEMRLPIIGIVSDKQSSLILGAKEIFPNISHQYCQFHYLRNISKDFEERDRGLRKKIRKSFRGIYNTTKTLDNNLKNGKISSTQ